MRGDWVEVLALARHYEPTRVEAARTANGFTVTTANVTALRLVPPPAALFAQTVKIDGQEVAAKPVGGKIELVLRDGPVAAMNVVNSPPSDQPSAVSRQLMADG